MSKEKLKKELHELIDKIENEAMLSMVKEDIVGYQKAETRFDDLSDLTPEERADLEELANEPPEKDAVSFVDYKKEMKQWLSKL
jgi:hypothetical protein